MSHFSPLLTEFSLALNQQIQVQSLIHSVWKNKFADTEIDYATCVANRFHKELAAADRPIVPVLRERFRSLHRTVVRA